MESPSVKCLLKITLLLFAVFHCSGRLKAEGVDTLFKSDEVLILELRSDFLAIKSDTAKDPGLHAGTLVIRTPGGKTKKYSVGIRARGEFRRDPVNCSFPPLLVNFKKKDMKKSVFHGQEKLKLVTPCQTEGDVVEEYLIYRMYNRVTDLSLKVRLAKILYFDTGTGRELFEKYSFFIEDEGHMAKRNGAVKTDRFLTPFEIDRQNYRRMSIFEYLIGNKDWYLTARKNIVIVESELTPGILYSVPYDFDVAGLVNAIYTKPDNVPDAYLSERRIYKGLCYTEEEFAETFEYFKKLKPVFDEILNNQAILQKAGIREVIKYLENSYKIIDDKASLKKEFLDVCETRKTYNLPE